MEGYKMRKRDGYRGRLFLLSLMVLVLVLPAWSLNAAERITAKDWRNGFVEVAKKVKPSVVAIRSERTVSVSPGEGFGEDFFKGTPFEDFFKQHGGPPVKRKQMGEGSGVIVDPKGYRHPCCREGDKYRNPRS